jgi:hypothetical protein
MIIHFDFSAAELAAAPQAVLEGCISEAIRAHRLGHHLLVINREASDYLRKNVSLNNVEITTIERLRSEFTQTADLIRRARVYLRIAALPIGTMRKIGNAVEVSLDQAIRPSLFEKTVLIVEDEISDGAFYQFLFANLRDIAGIPATQCDWVHGGGDRTIEVARNRVRDKRIVTVIVDTDVFSPVCSEPLKVSELKSVGRDEAWPLIFVRVTPCKETENLIPIEIVSMLDCAVERNEELVALREIEAKERTRSDPREAYWLYFDIKRGCDHLYLAGLHANAKTWTLDKLSHAGLGPEDFELRGFGNHVVPQVVRGNAACARLRDCIRRRDWLLVFGDFLADAMWPCVGGVRQFT